MVEELYDSHDYCLLAEELEALKAELAEWRQDAERLAKEFIWVDGEYGEWHCIHCDQYATSAQREIQHYDNCPITLHRELVAKYGGARSILY